MILGLGTYGRSFTLTDPRRHKLGDPAKGGGDEGKYTGESGSLAYYEICQMGGTRVWDEEQQVPYIYKGDQWVGYDDMQSLKVKVNLANTTKHVLSFSVETSLFGIYLSTNSSPMVFQIKSFSGKFVSVKRV